MTLCKLIFRNVKKNLQDYLIYFLTLMLSVSIFYAFNSIETQPALQNLRTTKQLLADQTGIYISILSVMIAVVLAFLILYANRFLQKRRKKELGIYLLLGMKKRKVSGIFAGETLCVGGISLVCGLGLGVILSQGLSLLALRLFAVDIDKFQMVFSTDALRKTVCCFALIFLIASLFNVKAVSREKLADLLNAGRRNDVSILKGKRVHIFFCLTAIACMALSGILIQRYGIIPSRRHPWIQAALALWLMGTVLFFFSVSSAVLKVLQSRSRIYLKKLNAFLCRQLGSRIRTDFLVLAAVSILLTVAVCGVSVGVSAAVTMNEASRAALPFDLNVLADVEISGDTDISVYLSSRGVQMEAYAERMEQISLYEGDLTYADLFEGQKVSLWPIDQEIPKIKVYIVSLSDFNRSLAMQGKEPVSLSEGEFLLNCNYKGTMEYICAFLQTHETITLNGRALRSAASEPLNETYWMTSVGNNDRGTVIVPDSVIETGSFTKSDNVLLVKYRPDTDSEKVLQKMIPIGLEWETEGYRYTEKNMLNDLYYGAGALMVFLCCYIGLVFLLVCAVLLSLKQLTETADNVYRYGLLKKLGAPESWVNAALTKQIAVFFLAPLVPAVLFSGFAMGKITAVIEEFMNMHIASHTGFTVFLLLLVYGGYFLAACLSCRRMIRKPAGF